MDINKDASKLDMPFYGAFGSTAVSFILTLISYASPYWLQSYPFVHSDFLRSGLWSICFNNYIHLKDNQGNIWDGCYWIFDRQIIIMGMWEYFDPYWLIAIQVMITVVLILQIICFICMILYFLLYGQPAAESATTLYCQISSIVIMFISVMTYGIMCQQRYWMPRPDHNHLSWSFGFAVLSMVASLIAVCFLWCVNQSDTALQKEFEFYEQYGPNMPMLASEYQPSYMGTQYSQPRRGPGSQSGFQPLVGGSQLGGGTMSISGYPQEDGAKWSQA